MGVPLLELVIEDTSPGDELTQLTLTHSVIESHPPAFRVDEGGVVGRSGREQVATEILTLAAPITEAPGDDMLPVEILDALGVSNVIPGFIDRVVQPSMYDALPPETGRVVIVGGAVMWELRWEELSSLDNRFKYVAWIRRWSAGSFAPPQPLRFPIKVGLEPVAERDLLEVELFDDFVRYVADEGAASWGPGTGGVDVLHHLVLEGWGSEVVDTIGGLNTVPRLVVLHLSGPVVPVDGVSRAAHALLSEGVAAVAAVPALLGDAGAFFQPFYRKLMHNWPLEFCLWAGIDALRSQGHYPIDARLFALEEGEHSLALSRVIAETAAEDRPLEAAAPPDDEWLDFEAAVPSGLEIDRGERAATDAWDGMREGALERANDLAFTSEQVETGWLLNLTRQVTGESGAAAAKAQRMTNVTIGRPGTWAPVLPNQALEQGVSHSMWIRIEPFIRDAQVSEVIDESALEQIFETQDSVDIDIVVFTPDSDFTVDDAHQRVKLPRVGSSERADFNITPQRPGWCRFRVGVYYRNTMLQSLAVEAFCAAGGGDVDTSPTIRRTTDWLASTDLQLLHELPAPLFNIFTNEDHDGTHWIGVFSDKGDDGLPLRSGQMMTFDSEDLLARHKDLIDKLQEVHGESYRYPQDKPPNDPAVVSFGSEGLIELARLGRRVYKHVFEGATDAVLSVDRLDEVLGTMKENRQQLISVARTHGKWSLPWAAMYDLFLDVASPLDHEVCPVFESHLEQNWAADGSPRSEVADHLDDPVACRAQPTCPLSDASKRKVTVCPFGFWGFRHQIEQPLQHVTATAPDAVPDEMQSAAFSQASLIIQAPDDPLRVAAGFFPFAEAESHADELEQMVGAGFEWAEDRDDVMGLLYDDDGHHLFYFYCHGVAGDAFALQVGPEGSDHNLIEAASIERELMHWGSSETPQPLVILVACDSVAMSPEQMHGLFDVFRNAKASGVIGAEISIGKDLGREFGRGLVETLNSGDAVGEAFLRLRHDLLRRHNPLGLAFTSFAPATLHIHPAEGDCAWCVEHELVRT